MTKFHNVVVDKVGEIEDEVHRSSIQLLWIAVAMICSFLLIGVAAIGIIATSGISWDLLFVAIPAVVLSIYFSRELIK